MSSCSDDDDFFDAPMAEGELPALGAASAGPTSQLPPATPPIPARTRSTSLHLGAASNDLTKTGSKRYSLREPVPPIPEHFLHTGHPAFVTAASIRKEGHDFTLLPPTTYNEDDDEGEATRSRVASTVPERDGGELNNAIHSRAVTRLSRASRWLEPASHKSLPASPTHLDPSTLDRLERNSARGEDEDMAPSLRDRDSDLFLEMADASSGGERGLPSRTAQRTSYAAKRRSLPAGGLYFETHDERPNTSGNMSARVPSRLNTGTNSSDLQRHVERYRTSVNRSALYADDAQSVSSRSRLGRQSHYSTLHDRPSALLAERVRSPEVPQYGRRRPSSGAASADLRQRDNDQFLTKAPSWQDESPAESSEPKQADSASVDSQTADTVWDELDDLKSRIKKLELTGKMPPSSSAAISGDSSDRPRTATTAPTTIDSSPKHERKAEPESESRPPPSTEAAVGGAMAANIHPLLHSALAKAKLLVNSALYRTLEATASDALQLAAMTGSAGPQGTTFSAASIINGATVPDRHIRRKADNMCRNLTDLCLALCDGKHESPVATPSPSPLEFPKRDSPMARYSRSSLSPGITSTTRPMSRLEARKSSILGMQAISNQGSNEDVSTPEQERGVVTASASFPSRESRRMERVSSGLLRSRLQRPESVVNTDDDPTIRPPSRAVTETGSFLARARTMSKSPAQQRTPSSRESFSDMAAARRNNENTQSHDRELSRVASFGSDPRRRRLYDHATPPVLEEDDSSDILPAPQPRRRITSFGHHSSRRAGPESAPGRAASLSQRRHVIVE